MPTVVLDGVATHYEEHGTGPPLLMFSPGGFDATLSKWSTQSVYARLRPLEHLAEHFRCLVFDRRETGLSGGRIERIAWADYVAQGRALLDHLGIARALLMGGCMGCCPVAAFAVAHPERVAGAVMFWPVGGPRYRISSHRRFHEHLAFVDAEGLDAVVAVAAAGKSFGADPRGGPWATLLHRDPAFARAFVGQDAARYRLLVSAMGRTLFDRDTVPGAEPEDLMRVDAPTLIVPGADAAHAPSAARYLQECLPGSELWDVAPDAQAGPETMARLLSFLRAAADSGTPPTPAA